MLKVINHGELREVSSVNSIVTSRRLFHSDTLQNVVEQQRGTETIRDEKSECL